MIMDLQLKDEVLVRLDGETFRPEFLAIPLGEIDIIDIII
jgi:hypothetical protein